MKLGEESSEFGVKRQEAGGHKAVLGIEIGPIESRKD
jgi:hypothetical protein